MGQQQKTNTDVEDLRDNYGKNISPWFISFTEISSVFLHANYKLVDPLKIRRNERPRNAISCPRKYNAVHVQISEKISIKSE